MVVLFFAVTDCEHSVMLFVNRSQELFHVNHPVKNHNCLIENRTLLRELI